MDETERTTIGKAFSAAVNGTQEEAAAICTVSTALSGIEDESARVGKLKLYEEIKLSLVCPIIRAVRGFSDKFCRK